MKKIVRKDLVKFLETKGIKVLKSSTKRVKRSAEPEMPTYEIRIYQKDDEAGFGFDYFNDGYRYAVGFWELNNDLENFIKQYLNENNIEYWEM